jgi:hypothetical protein
VLGTLWNREKSYWRCLAKFSQTCSNLWHTGLSGVCTGQHLVLRLARSANWLLSIKVGGGTTIIHRTVRCATWTSPMVTRSHRTVRCATKRSGVPRGPVAAIANFARKGRKSHTVYCPVVHWTVRCAHGQKTTMAFQLEL